MFWEVIEGVFHYRFEWIFLQNKAFLRNESSILLKPDNKNCYLTQLLSIRKTNTVVDSIWEVLSWICWKFVKLTPNEWLTWLEVVAIPNFKTLNRKNWGQRKILDQNSGIHKSNFFTQIFLFIKPFGYPWCRIAFTVRSTLDEWKWESIDLTAAMLTYPKIRFFGRAYLHLGTKETWYACCLPVFYVCCMLFSFTLLPWTLKT